MNIIVGKLASADGSVMTSHTGACDESRIHVAPAKTYKKGERASVYYGLLNVRTPLHDYGEIIRYVPQAEKTLAYFYTGYPHRSIIKGIDLSRPDYFMASKNYKQIAIDHGWSDPKSDEPLESSFFKEQTSLDAKALELYKKDPDQAKRFLTRYTNEKDGTDS